MPNFKPLDATSGDDDDDKDDGFLNDDSDEQGVGNDSVRQSPRLTSPPRKTTTMVSVPASSSSSKLPGIVMNSASTSTMRSSSNAAMAVASSSNSAMTPSAPLPSSGPAPRNFITESQGVTSSPRSFNPADPRYTTATSPPKSAASTASHNTLGTPSLWSRVFGGKEPSQITHLRQLGNNVKSISSAQFKQQMDKFSGHRPANLYDPHHENDDGSPSQMDAATFRVRFLAFQQRLHMFLEDPSSSFASLVCNMLLILIIVIGTISMCLETVDGLYIDNPGIWFAIDTFVTFIFTVELLARLTARCTSRRSFFGFLTSMMR